MSRKIAGLIGTYEVRRNLKRALGRKTTASMVGLLHVAAYIRLSMDTTPPLIPINTGELRASWYATPDFIDGKPVVHIGFRALHAIFAHEMDWQEGTRPGSGPKFLQSALNRSRKKMRAIIAQYARTV